MSPILVRPVREQFEHDRVIRVLQARYKRKYEVVINPGAEQNASVDIGDLVMYPDLVLFSQERSRKMQGTVEVETVESINTLEAMAQWGPFSRLRAAFFLYVPANTIDTVRRLCTEYAIDPAEIWTYHVAIDQVRFTMVHRSPDAPRTPEPRPDKALADTAKVNTARGERAKGDTSRADAPAAFDDGPGTETPVAGDETAERTATPRATSENARAVTLAATPSAIAKTTKVPRAAAGARASVPVKTASSGKLAAPAAPAKVGKATKAAKAAKTVRTAKSAPSRTAPAAKSRTAPRPAAAAKSPARSGARKATKPAVKTAKKRR